jgi:hypothetical protein
MNKSKKIFLLLAAIFLVIVVIVMIDMASKTTFPGKNNDSPGQVDEDTAERREFDQY